MFVATIINFLLSSLSAANHVAGFIVFIRKALMIIVDTDYPLSEKPELINIALRKTNTITTWAIILPVSFTLPV